MEESSGGLPRRSDPRTENGTSHGWDDATFSRQNSQGGRRQCSLLSGPERTRGPTQSTSSQGDIATPQEQASRIRQPAFEKSPGCLQRDSSLGWRAGHDSRHTLRGGRAAGHCVRGAPRGASHPLRGGPAHSTLQPGLRCTKSYVAFRVTQRSTERNRTCLRTTAGPTAPSSPAVLRLCSSSGPHLRGGSKSCHPGALGGHLE